jgi:hypothetical protein
MKRYKVITNESTRKIITIYWGLGAETCPKILRLKIYNMKNFRTVKKAEVQMSEAKGK